VEVVASLSQGRTAAAQCSLFTYKSVPVIFEPPCTTFSALVSGWDTQEGEIHLSKTPNGINGNVTQKEYKLYNLKLQTVMLP